MRKTLALLTAAVMILLSVSGCTTAPAPTRTAYEFTAAPETETPTEPPTEAPTEEPKEYFNFDNDDIYKLSVFSEGLALASYNTYPNGRYHKGEPHTCIIKRDGEIVATFDLPVDRVRPFQDGYAILGVTEGSSDKSYYDMIVDKEGNITYRTDNITSTGSTREVSREAILCYGNGKFVMMREFDGLETKSCLGTIDAYGNVIDDFTVSQCTDIGYLNSWNTFSQSQAVYDLSFKFHVIKNTRVNPSANSYDRDYEGSDGLYRYLGDDIYLVCPGRDYPIAYSPSRGIAIETKVGMRVDDVLIDSSRKNTHGIDIIDYKTFLDTFGKIEADTLFTYSNNSWGSLVPGDKGWFYTNDHTYIDKSGKVVLELKDYADHEMWCSSFNGGYALMVIQGSNNKNQFVTVINEAGEIQFEPFEVHSYSACVKNGQMGVYNIKGERIAQLDGTSINYLADDYLIYGGPLWQKYYFLNDASAEKTPATEAPTAAATAETAVETAAPAATRP